MKDKQSAGEIVREIEGGLKDIAVELGVYRLLDWLEDKAERYFFTAMVIMWVVLSIVLLTAIASMLYSVN